MKTALITGTTRGIGKALAERFMNEGWRVIGTAVSGLNIENSDKFKGYDLDLSSPESIEAFTNALGKEGVKIDFVMNNAGVCLESLETSVVMEKLRGTLEVNLFGLVDLTERLIPLLSPDAQIFNMSSTAGQLSKDLDLSRRYPAYKISKAALNMYTRTLAARLAEEGKFVASIHPGWVQTGMGGAEAEFTPDEAAGYIYEFAAKKKPVSLTGLFWHKGEKLSW